MRLESYPVPLLEEYLYTGNHRGEFCEDIQCHVCGKFGQVNDSACVCPSNYIGACCDPSTDSNIILILIRIHRATSIAYAWAGSACSFCAQVQPQS